MLRGTPSAIPTFTAKFSSGSALLVDEGRRTIPLLELSDGVEEVSRGVSLLHGAVVCSWGLHASLVAESDTAEYRKHGSERFSMAAKELLSPSDGSAPHAYRGRVTIFRSDGKEEVLERKEHMYILATLVSNLEEKFRISPHSKPLDGQLRLVHFGVLDSEEILKVLGLAFDSGKHVEDERVGYEPVEGFRIDFEEENERWRRIMNFSC